MLVLTRKLQEQISIGQDITITVLRVKGNTVRIGIDAPNHVRVVRAELPRFDTPVATADTAQDQQPATEYDPVRQLPRRSPDMRRRTTGLKPMVEQVSQRNRDRRTESLSVTAAID